jgi:hypothetical protein
MTTYQTRSSGHLELRVVRIVLGRCGRLRSVAAGTVIQHDHAGIALTHLVAGRARQQRVSPTQADDHQRAGLQLSALIVIDQ